jgi:hypothetical protein
MCFLVKHMVTKYSRVLFAKFQIFFNPEVFPSEFKNKYETAKTFYFFLKFSQNIPNYCDQMFAYINSI